MVEFLNMMLTLTALCVGTTWSVMLAVIVGKNIWKGVFFSPKDTLLVCAILVISMSLIHWSLTRIVIPWT